MTEVTEGKDQVLEQVHIETISDVSDAVNMITLLKIFKT